jgi:hypothetical protein
MAKKRMVLYSGQRVGSDSPFSVLALLETVLASFVGLLLVWFGEYWILWTSLFLTFLVHLRSEKSVEDGVRTLDRSWTTLTNAAPTRRILVVSLVAAFCIALVWIFFVAPILFASFGWIGSYGSLVLVGFISLNILVASAVFVLLLSLFLSGGVEKKEPSNDGTADATSKRILIISVIFGTVLLPGAVASVTACFVIIRSISTLRYLRDGLANFLQNWTTLMLRTDITTEPELLPGLPDDHTFSFASAKNGFTHPEQDIVNKYSNLLPLGVFVPSIFYRLVLKSSFWFYAPLMWVASPPRSLHKQNDGTFRWDPSLARTPLDVVAAFVALFGTFFLFFRIWDNSAYQAAATWVKANDFPAYWPLLAAGIDPMQLDVWYLLPSVGAVLSLTVFIWAAQISARAKLDGRFPSQLTLWFLYKLNSAKNIASLLTVALGIVFLLVYYNANCQSLASMREIPLGLSGPDCVLP